MMLAKSLMVWKLLPLRSLHQLLLPSLGSIFGQTEAIYGLECPIGFHYCVIQMGVGVNFSLIRHAVRFQGNATTESETMTS